MLSTLLVFILLSVTCHGINQEEDEIKSMSEVERNEFIGSLAKKLNSSTSITTNATSARRLEKVTKVIDPIMDKYKEEVKKIFPIIAQKTNNATFSRRDDEKSGDEEAGPNSSADDNVSENDNQEKKSSEKNGDNEIDDDNNDQDTDGNDGNDQDNKDSDVEDIDKDISFKEDEGDDDDDKNKSIDDEHTPLSTIKSFYIGQKPLQPIKKDFKDFTYRSANTSNTVKGNSRTERKKTNNSTTVNATKSHVVEKRSGSAPQKNLQPDDSHIDEIQSYNPKKDTNVSTISQDMASITESENVTVSVEIATSTLDLNNSETDFLDQINQNKTFPLAFLDPEKLLKTTSTLDLNNSETDFLDQINQNKTFPLAFLDPEKLLKTTSAKDNTSKPFTKMNDLIEGTTKMGTFGHSDTITSSTEKVDDNDQSVDTEKPSLEQFDEKADDFLTASTLVSSNDTMNTSDSTGRPSPTEKQLTETIENKTEPIASTTAQTKQERAQEDIQLNLGPETTTLHSDGEQLSAPESTQMEQPYFFPVHDYAAGNAYYNPLNYLGVNIPAKIINIEPKDDNGKKIVSIEKHFATNKFLNKGKSHVPYKVIDNFAGDMKDYLEHSRIAYHKMLEDLNSNNNGRESIYLDVQPATGDRDDDLAMDYFLKRDDNDMEVEDPVIKRQHSKPKTYKPEYELYYKTPKGYISQYNLADVNKAIHDQINKDMKDFTKAFNVAPTKDIPLAINDQMNEGMKAFTKLSPTKDVPQDNADLESFIRVMDDMITTNDEKLINYDWLATTVDIQGAIEKLISLSDNFDKGLFVHPYDVSILRYTQHLYNDVRPHGPLKNNLKRQVNTLRKGNAILTMSLRRMHTLPLVHYNKQVSLRKFLVELRQRLFNLHNSIKYIASVTTYRNQHWFQNLKDLYLRQPLRPQVLEVLLHIFASRFFSLIDQSAMSGMQEDYIMYLQSEEGEVLRVENELKVVQKILSKLNSFD